MAITSPFRLYEQNDELIIKLRGRERVTEALREKHSYLWMMRNYLYAGDPGIRDYL